ncbi:metalloregulator ArsR/SmtB family transcription factor [Anoxynatronum sibiricum]|uniref:Metalloregulator ArsR/SmtB family transcription factor n=1 Tax=Anoxynatronum sibiricum TaxID=210623 RepID=A0ABU9VRI8_9CLOT
MPHNNDNVTIIQLQQAADLLKAMGHPVRLCILKRLADYGVANVQQLQHCLSVPQSTVSQHLAVLRNTGIIQGQRQGLEIHYRIIHPQVPALIQQLQLSMNDPSSP